MIAQTQIYLQQLRDLLKIRKGRTKAGSCRYECGELAEWISKNSGSIKPELWAYHNFHYHLRVQSIIIDPTIHQFFNSHHVDGEAPIFLGSATELVTELESLFNKYGPNRSMLTVNDATSGEVIYQRLWATAKPV